MNWSELKVEFPPQLFSQPSPRLLRPLPPYLFLIIIIIIPPIRIQKGALGFQITKIAEKQSLDIFSSMEGDSGA
jgi:hypothetical protein